MHTYTQSLERLEQEINALALKQVKESTSLESIKNILEDHTNWVNSIGTAEGCKRLSREGVFESILQPALLRLMEKDTTNEIVVIFTKDSRPLFALLTDDLIHRI